MSDQSPFMSMQQMYPQMAGVNMAGFLDGLDATSTQQHQPQAANQQLQRQLISSQYAPQNNFGIQNNQSLVPSTGTQGSAGGQQAQASKPSTPVSGPLMQNAMNGAMQSSGLSGMATSAGQGVGSLIGTILGFL